MFDMIKRLDPVPPRELGPKSVFEAALREMKKKLAATRLA